MVYTTLAELAYLDGDTVGRGAFWVIGVWYHPTYPGTGPDTWCVDYGIVPAVAGGRTGHHDDCPLPVGMKPRRVAAGG